MEAVLRRLKLKRGEPQETEARKRLQQDLFAFDQVSRSLPHFPRALILSMVYVPVVRMSVPFYCF